MDCTLLVDSQRNKLNIEASRAAFKRRITNEWRARATQHSTALAIRMEKVNKYSTCSQSSVDPRVYVYILMTQMPDLHQNLMCIHET